MEPPLKRQHVAKSQDQLHQQRARNDLRLKSRFEHIFEKFSKDFTGVGDEIDMSTGKVIVNNGHLLTMQNERDTEGLANDEDELAVGTVGPSKELEADKSKVSGNPQGNAAEVVSDLPLPVEVPCVGLNIASAIKMDDGTTYDSNVHGDLFINRNILDQLSRLAPHIRKSIANVKRSSTTSLVVSIETEDLTVDPKWRVPVILQQKPEEKVDEVVEASEPVEAEPVIQSCDPERSQSPEGVSLWALDSMPLVRNAQRRKDAAVKVPRPEDQVLQVSKPKDPKLKDPKPKDPKPRASKPKDSMPVDPISKNLQPEDSRSLDLEPKDSKSISPTPKISKSHHPKSKDAGRGNAGHANLAPKDQAGEDQCYESGSTMEMGNMLRYQRAGDRLTLEQISSPGQGSRSAAQRRDFMRLDDMNRTPLSIPSTDSEDSEGAASSPSDQKQGNSLDASKNAHSSHTSGLTREISVENATTAPRNWERGLYRKTGERLSIPDTHEAEPNPSELAVSGESGIVLDGLVKDITIPLRKRKRGHYRTSRERLSVPDTHPPEQAEPTELAIKGASSAVAGFQAPDPQENERSNEKIIVPERPQTYSETPETVRSHGLAPAAIERDTEPVAQSSSLRKTRVHAHSKLAGVPTPANDHTKKLPGKPGKGNCRSSYPSPLNHKEKSVVSGIMRSIELTPPSLVSSSAPDGIASSRKLNSSVNTRVSLGDTNTIRGRAIWSVSSSPDPMADGSSRTNNKTEPTLSKPSLRKTAAQQRISKLTPKKRQANPASSAPRISLSSILGDASDDELSNIQSKDEVRNSTKSLGSAIKSRPCGSPGYNCKRSLCLTCG